VTVDNDLMLCLVSWWWMMCVAIFSLRRMRRRGWRQNNKDRNKNTNDSGRSLSSGM